MAVTWDVVQLDSTKTVGSLSDVITTVHWTASDADGDHTGYAYGSVVISDADSSSFTAYASVTKENAIAWAKAALGSDVVTATETSIASQITESKTPATTSGVPW
tara:strand:- start:101 stop:415 length:315 start_codon:yes stop_codon:yes gene_type:complete